MLIPTGARGAAGLVVRGATGLDVEDAPKSRGRSKASGQKITKTSEAATYAFADVADRSLLTSDDLLALGRLKDRLQAICTTDRLGETPLRFLEYDRTAAEAAGDPYLGDGDRETLGMAFTDEFGNYVFRFDRTLSELLTEAEDALPGQAPEVAALPDLILQIMDELPESVAWESAPYYNVPNVKRIDLCVPEFEPYEQPCQGGRAIQFLGDIAIFPNSHSELIDNPASSAYGTVSNDSSAPAGPTVEHAAWWATVPIVGCFDDPDVTEYTFEYWRPGDTDWAYVNEVYEHWKILPNGTGVKERVGPYPRPVGPGGTNAPTYDNIEDDTTWAAGHRHRKLFLDTRRYQPVSGLATFRIQGYDSSHNPVPSAVDTFTLRIDNHLSTGSFEFVRLPSTPDPGDCALLDLPSNTAPVEVRYRVEDPEGFLSSYSLTVARGPGTNVPIAGSPVSGAYVDVSPFSYQGTPGYITVTVTPAGSGTWLPPGHSFCAFSFRLTSNDRVTNGRTVPDARRLATELIGMSLPSGSGSTP